MSVLEPKLHHVAFPLLLKFLNVTSVENSFQRLVAAGIFDCILPKRMIVLDQQPSFLQIITEVASLRVVGTVTIVELSGCR